jgi:DNA gyrase/topoisomerase IV subunit B
LLKNKEEIVSTFSDERVYVGEQDADELSECLLDPATRNVVQITVEDIKKTNTLFETFMGPSVGPRRDYILKFSEEANDV